MTVPIDVSAITESQEVTVPIPLQDDIFAIKPETITVQIEVEKMNYSSFENIPIGYIGLNDALCTIFY